MIFDERRLKSSYVGIVYIFDLRSKEVILKGGGQFDVLNKKLDILFDCPDIYKDLEWLPIIQTESGFFSPTNPVSGHLLGFTNYAFDHRKTFDMSSYFHWPTDKKLEYITHEFDSIVVDVDGIYGNRAFPDFSKDDGMVAMTSKGIVKNLKNYSANDLKITIKTFANTRDIVEQKVRFRVSSSPDAFSHQNWIQIVHAFRLYWLFQHERVDCTTTNFAFGESLTLVSDMMKFKGYNDGTEIVEKGLHINKDMNPELLTKTLHFFIREAKGGKNAGIEFAFYRLLGFRFNTGPKRAGDDILDLIFALDGFSADICKGLQTKLTKQEKANARTSISKIIGEIEKIKDKIDPLVYDFYNQPVDVIFSKLAQKPFKERMRLCFTALGRNYDDNGDTMKKIDLVRQTFVHGKGYDPEDMINHLYTHSTTKLQQEADSMQIIFGQETGLSDQCYKMIRSLFSKYFAA